MNKDGTIDFGKLEKQLLVAVDEDARYRRENDAKFRAVAQNVASYEEFKDIVAASHLKPLDKKDTEGLHNRKQPWNPYAGKSSEKTASPKDNILSGDLNVPRNSHEFQKYWRKCQKDKVKKYQYLITIGGPTLAEIFQAEISMALLGEIVDIFNENWKADDFSKIYDILHGLATVKRFSLSLQFLSGREKKVLIELFQKLNEVIVERQRGDCVHVECLGTLEKSYGVTVEMRDQV
ncbi:coiled-coil domain-containing 103-like [Paramuricea clavata]|uniref:Coiled-coil domain-containing 103-like n=1 Tax=Paramuricea clavata TaxID=317549 RepID=A0A7D9DSY6_PARCT|nr:coiled-coil domain-containing 103-like [Paramuricea clavata]